MIETAELYKLTGARQRCAALPLAHRLRPHREARLGDVFCHLRLVVSRGAPRCRQTRAKAVVVHGRSPSCGSEIFYLQYIGYCKKTQAFFSYKAKNYRLISLIKRIYNTINLLVRRIFRYGRAEYASGDDRRMLAGRGAFPRRGSGWKRKAASASQCASVRSAAGRRSGSWAWNRSGSTVWRCWADSCGAFELRYGVRAHRWTLWQFLDRDVPASR